MFTGQVGITMNFDWHEPKNKTNPMDLEASEIANNFFLGWFAHPVFVNGDYPAVMKEKIANKSIHQKYNESRLPSFSDQEKSYIKGKHVLLFVGTNFHGFYKMH